MDNYLIMLVLLPIVVILILIVLVAIKISRNQISRKKLFKEYPNASEIEEAEKDAFLEAFGGSENIESVNREMSRISVTVKDVDIVLLEQLKALGATGVLVMGNEVKCSFKDKAEYIYHLIKKG